MDLTFSSHGNPTVRPEEEEENISTRPTYRLHLQQQVTQAPPLQLPCGVEGVETAAECVVTLPQDLLSHFAELGSDARLSEEDLELGGVHRLCQDSAENVAAIADALCQAAGLPKYLLLGDCNHSYVCSEDNRVTATTVMYVVKTTE